MSSPPALSTQALWNRATVEVQTDEMLAQILDRGEMASWRALYKMAETDPALRARIKHVIVEVPTPLPRFWLAALASLGEVVDFDLPLPDYYAATAV